MSLISSRIEISDIFDELLNENQRLLNQLVFADKCLNVLNKFKTFVDLVFNNYKIDFNSNDSLNYQTLKAEVEEVLNESQKLNEHLIEDPEEEGVVATEEPSTQCLKQTTNKVIELFECKVNGCQYKTTVIEDIERHFDKKHKNLSKKFDCRFCGKGFLSDSSLKNHMRRDHSNEIITKQLSNSVQKDTEIQNDMSEEELNNQSKPKAIQTKSVPKFECDFNGCHYRTDSHKRFDKHRNKHQTTEQFECVFKSCGKLFSSKLNLKKHIKEVHQNIRQYKCKFIGCDFENSFKYNVLNHENIVHKKISPFECIHCKLRFGCELYLIRHIRRTHETNEEFKCKYPGCDKVYKKEFSLREHIDKIHLKIVPKYRCDQLDCQYSSYMFCKIIAHKNAVHSKTERPKHVCDFEGCSKLFKSKDILREHVKFKHLGYSLENRYKCNQCGLGFKWSSSLDRHKVEHSNKILRCDWPGCEYTSKIESNLKRHVTIHSTEKFQCDWPECYKSFKSKNYLNQHLGAHKDEKKYACEWPGCQFRSSYPQCIVKHRKIHKK